MDGVLLVTRQSPAQSWREVAEQFAPVLDIATDTLMRTFQKSRQMYEQEIEHDSKKQQRDRLEPFETRMETIEMALKLLDKEDKQIATEMVRTYELLREAHSQLAPHALEVLQKLRQQSFPLALVSNGNATYQRRKIARHHLAQFFDVILIEGEFGVAKPDRRIFLHALDQLRISADKAWMIGDDLACDIAGAQQIGIFATWCDFARQGLPDAATVRPNLIIYDLLEVYQMLSS